MKTAADRRLPRRRFLQQTGLSAAGVWLTGGALARGGGSPNGLVNVAFVGVAHRAADNLAEISKLTESAKVVALCDVDDHYLADAQQHHPAARTYNDFREMLAGRDIDAVVVSTPDHCHAAATAAALHGGRHVYCEKPLTHTVAEARRITELAQRTKRVTQIGTQIHAGTNYRRVVELIQTGAIGSVLEAHVWCGATYGGKSLPPASPPVPPGLHWDLWLGPVPPCPYHPEYLPTTWRNWWAFGGGTLADFGCHFMDLPFWALGLRYPEVIEVLDGPPVHPESVPPWLIVRYQYPGRAPTRTGVRQPPITLTWYHGGKQPQLLTDEQATYFKSGVLFVGEQGRLLADYTRRVLLPEESFTDFKAPTPFIPDSIGHHKEWIEAIRTGGTTTCQFGYSGPLTEAALLGNVAYRVGQRLDWDHQKLRVRNCRAATPFIQYQYRSGWRL